MIIFGFILFICSIVAVILTINILVTKIDNTFIITDFLTPATERETFTVSYKGNSPIVGKLYAIYSQNNGNIGTIKITNINEEEKEITYFNITSIRNVFEQESQIIIASLRVGGFLQYEINGVLTCFYPDRKITSVCSLSQRTQKNIFFIDRRYNDAGIWYNFEGEYLQFGEQNEDGTFSINMINDVANELDAKSVWATTDNFLSFNRRDNITKIISRFDTNYYLVSNKKNDNEGDVLLDNKNALSWRLYPKINIPLKLLNQEVKTFGTDYCTASRMKEIENSINAALPGGIKCTIVACGNGGLILDLLEGCCITAKNTTAYLPVGASNIKKQYNVYFGVGGRLLWSSRRREYIEMESGYTINNKTVTHKWNACNQRGSNTGWWSQDGFFGITKVNIEVEASTDSKRTVLLHTANKNTGHTTATVHIIIWAPVSPVNIKPCTPNLPSD